MSLSLLRGRGQVHLNAVHIRHQPVYDVSRVSVILLFCEPDAQHRLFPGSRPIRPHTDNAGIGMSKEFQEHVFEPFERERTSTVSGIQGTGLASAVSI